MGEEDFIRLVHSDGKSDGNKVDIDRWKRSVDSGITINKIAKEVSSDKYFQKAQLIGGVWVPIHVGTT